MRYGVFSDVHSNIEALGAVLDFLAAQKVEGYICCGDMVGYGPNPNEVLERIRGLKNLAVVCGNHDLAAIGRMDAEWFNPYARAAVLWTRDVLSGPSRLFLESLSARLDAPGFTIAHGSPRRPAEEYLLTAVQFKANMSSVRSWPLFVGHSHMPLVLRVSHEAATVKGRKETEDVEVLFIEPGDEIVCERRAYGVVPTAFNPGSAGQPRDHDPRASCAVYDSEALSFRIHRVPYDVAAVQAKIRALGLPEFLALRLAYGQ